MKSLLAISRVTVYCHRSVCVIVIAVSPMQW